MTEIPTFLDDLPRDDPSDRLVRAKIARIEEELYQHQWTLELHQGFAGLKDDDRFKRLMHKMAEHRSNLLERLAIERAAPVEQIRWFQAYIQAMSYFMQLSKGDPEDVKKARTELPGLTQELANWRRLLHVPTGSDSGPGAGGEDGSQG